MLLISYSLVSFYLGGDKADGCKRKCLLPLANVLLHQFISLVIICCF